METLGLEARLSAKGLPSKKANVFGFIVLKSVFIFQK